MIGGAYYRDLELAYRVIDSSADFDLAEDICYIDLDGWESWRLSFTAVCSRRGKVQITSLPEYSRLYTWY